MADERCYDEVTVVVEGAVSDSINFDLNGVEIDGDRVLDDLLAALEGDATSQNLWIEVFVLEHPHPVDTEECECAQFVTDGHPNYSWGKPAEFVPGTTIEDRGLWRQTKPAYSYEELFPGTTARFSVDPRKGEFVEFAEAGWFIVHRQGEVVYIPRERIGSVSETIDSCWYRRDPEDGEYQLLLPDEQEALERAWQAGWIPAKD